jgi:hypothetical protein
MRQVQTDNEGIPLAEFGPVIPPDPIPWSFDTPGWYVAMTLLVLALLIIGLIRWQHYRANKYRRDAVAYIDRLVEDHALSNIDIINNCNQLIRRIVLRQKQAAEFSIMSHEQWCQWLNSLCQKSTFQKEDADLMFQSAYRNALTIDKQVYEQHLGKVRYWVKNHRFE